MYIVWLLLFWHPIPTFIAAGALKFGSVINIASVYPRMVQRGLNSVILPGWASKGADIDVHAQLYTLP